MNPRKIVDIALKDLLRSFRSMFLLVMMLIAPLLLTGLIYFAFGSSGGGGFNLPVTHVVVANLDKPDQQSGLAAGKLLAGHLAGTEMSSMLEVKTVPDEASAIRAVDGRQADVAVIIPAGFTAAAVGQGGSATVRLYHDPTMSIGPGIVKTVVSEFVDGLSGATIAVQVANKQFESAGLTAGDRVEQSITEKYVAWVQASQSSRGEGQGASGSQLLAVRSPSSEAPQSKAGTQANMIPLIMASMLIFFVFFTGAACASTLVWEEEEGTLARLFTTPTSQSTILGGKFLGSILTLIVQALVLIFASMLLFNISWGNPGTLTIVVAALIVAAAGFGVFLMAFVRNSRQAGPIQGVVVTLTGMLGGLFTSFTALSVALENASLVVPQGWAMRGMKLTLAGASPVEVLWPATVLLGIGLALFAAGTLLFRRRFA
jgi:linearmycin/streptolysin S transport system permease protein